MVIEDIAPADPPVHHDKPAKSKKLKKKIRTRRLLKLVIPIVVVAVLAVSVYLWWKSLNGTNYGDIQNTLSSTEATTQDRPTEYTVLDLKHVQLSYPSQFQVATNQPKQPSLLDYRVLTSRTTGTSDTAQIGVTLKNAKTPIPDDSAYRFYSEKKSLYDIKPQTLQGETVYVVSKRSGFERAIFWQHQGMQLIVVVTSASDTTNELAVSSQKLLGSIAWQ